MDECKRCDHLEDLIRRYVNTVGASEGVDFIDQSRSWLGDEFGLSDDDVGELLRIAPRPK